MAQWAIMKKALCLTLATLALTACATTAPQAPTTPLAATYGQWQVVQCGLENTRAEITLRAQAKPEQNTLRVQLTAATPLPRAPEIILNNRYKLNQSLAGKDQVWAFEVPFEFIDQTEMELDKLFLQVLYQPEGSPRALQAIFSLRGLPLGMAALAAHCAP